jgi:hypothetical protein
MFSRVRNSQRKGEQSRDNRTAGSGLDSELFQCRSHDLKPCSMVNASNFYAIPSNFTSRLLSSFGINLGGSQHRKVVTIGIELNATLLKK